MSELSRRLRKLERYRLAQMFHEAVSEYRERLAAADHIASHHGVSAEQVLAVAEEFKPEAHWRL